MMRAIAFIFASIWMAVPAWGGSLVFAASSLKSALDPISEAYAQATGNNLVISYAATSQLVRQIQAGAPADVLLSAHPQWTARIEKPAVVFAGNALVIAGDANWPDPKPDARFAVPLVDAVPLGIYAKQALTSLGLWVDLVPAAIQTQNAAVARALVIRGEVAWGVLYASDAKGADLPVMPLDPNLYDPVQYDAISLTPQGQAFIDWLRGPEAQDILEAKGFERVD